jgi:hypothetical protein
MRIKILDFFDVLLVSEPRHIRWLNEHPDVVRPLDSAAGPLHRLLNGRLLTDLRFDGSVLPVFLSRGDARRAQRQAQLAEALDDLTGRPGLETERLGSYVAGFNGEAEVGVNVQQWCGQLISAAYRATEATYAAGRLIGNWPGVSPLRAFVSRARGYLETSKHVLAAAANGDAHCIHATSVGMENVARTVRRMRQVADRSGLDSRSPEQAMRECLAVPPVVLRGCAREVKAPFLREPLGRKSIVVFMLGRAYKESGDMDDAFLGESWSACPARHVVPGMLKEVWQAAAEAKVEHETGWRRILGTARQKVPVLVKSVVGAVQKNGINLSGSSAWTKVVSSWDALKGDSHGRTELD